MKKRIEEYHSGVEEEPEQVNSAYIFKEHIERYIADKTNARTKELYQYTLNKVGEYTDIDKLTFEGINYSWLKSFDKFMSDTCSTNSRAIHLRNIRSVFNEAIDEEKISLDTFHFEGLRSKQKPQSSDH